MLKMKKKKEVIIHLQKLLQLQQEQKKQYRIFPYII